MAATVTIRVNTDADAGTESGAQTGIDLISADNATNTATNRAANPITAGNKSYEKWLTARVDTAPDNAVDNFQLWGDGAVQASTALYVGKTATGVTPTSGDSSVATNDWTGYVSGTKFAWHATDMTGVGSTTDFACFQLMKSWLARQQCLEIIPVKLGESLTAYGEFEMNSFGHKVTPSQALALVLRGKV